MTVNFNEIEEQYPTWAWAVAAILCFILPPVGIFLVVFMFTRGQMRAEEENNE